MGHFVGGKIVPEKINIFSAPADPRARDGKKSQIDYFIKSIALEQFGVFCITLISLSSNLDFKNQLFRLFEFRLITYLFKNQLFGD